MTLTTAKWTVDEYHRIIDAGVLDDRHVELLKGEIVEMVFRDPVACEYTSKVTLTTGTIQPLSFSDISVSVDRIVSR